MKICDIAVPLLIAEEGQANQGDINVAFKMVDAALQSNADGIEFQFFLAKDMYVEGHKGFKIYKDNELKKEEIKKIIEYAKSNGLIVQIAGLSPEIIDYCASLEIDFFVINASDINNPQIIDSVINTGVDFWIATLMSTMEDIDWVVKYCHKKNVNNFGLLHGQHVMSTGKGGVPFELLQLDCINMLSKKYNLPIGFVDHTNSTLVPSLAVSKNAIMVTKHLSPSEDWSGPDSHICLDPKEFKICKQNFSIAINSSGSSKELSILEIADLDVHRRGVYLNKAKKAGEIITSEDISCLRPSCNTISPIDIINVINKKLAVDKDNNEPLYPEDIT
jgi:sialic acid synthase SpsE